jgi:hypothetical protein
VAQVLWRTGVSVEKHTGPCTLWCVMYLHQGLIDLLLPPSFVAMLTTLIVTNCLATAPVAEAGVHSPTTYSVSE